MGALIRAYDWTRTPLGAIEAWPQSLRTATSLMLESRFGMSIAWGRDFVQLYNDAYRPILGAGKHPAIGRTTPETFPEIWPTIGPMFDDVMRGEAIGFEDLLLPLDRDGFLEECFFTCSYSPIRDESDGVGGVLLTVSETTGRVLGARRLCMLRDLEGLAVRAGTPDDVLRAAASVVAANAADVPFAAFYTWDADVKRATLAAIAGLEPGHAATPVAIEPGVSAPAWQFERAGATRDLVVVDRSAWTSTSVAAGPWPEPIAKVAVLPLVAGEATHGFLVAGVSARRPVDHPYRDFLRLVASNVAGAMATVRARDDERRRAVRELKRVETELEAMLERERAARAEAEAANRSKDEFLAVLSHELRTPLNAIVGWARILNTTPASPTVQRRALDTIERNARLQAQLIDDLLDVSRIVAGKLVLEPVAVDLPRVAREVLQSMATVADGRGVRLDCVVADGVEPIAGDPKRLQQVVWNLLSNAVKFTPAGGQVTVRLGTSDDWTEIAVTDTGQGIDAAFLPHVFERFRQGDSTTTRERGGLGLGLAIVRHIVERHGGTVSAASDGVDRGATFTVRLPRQSPPSEADRLAHARPQDDVARVSPTLLAGVPVLVVEDEVDSREMIAKVLSDYGAGVTSVGSVDDALAALERAWPHVLVSDISMPDKDGYDLIRRLRALPAGGRRRVSAIAVTAYARPEDRLRSLFTGFDVHMPKPVDPIELALIVARLAGV